MVVRKGQFRIQQMMFMLMAVILFFALVGLFVIGIRTAGMKGIAQELEEENVKLLLTRLADSPEFSCGDSFDCGQTNCVDFDKVIGLKDKTEYENFWQVANIEIRKIYPDGSEIECTKENYPDCNFIKVYSTEVNSGAYYSNFVSLCRKELLEQENYDKCEIAKILVNYEVKE